MERRDHEIANDITRLAGTLWPGRLGEMTTAMTTTSSTSQEANEHTRKRTNEETNEHPNQRFDLAILRPCLPSGLSFAQSSSRDEEMVLLLDTKRARTLRGAVVFSRLLAFQKALLYDLDPLASIRACFVARVRSTRLALKFVGLLLWFRQLQHDSQSRVSSGRECRCGRFRPDAGTLARNEFGAAQSMPTVNCGGYNGAHEVLQRVDNHGPRDLSHSIFLDGSGALAAKLEYRRPFCDFAGRPCHRLARNARRNLCVKPPIAPPHDPPIYAPFARNPWIWEGGDSSRC